MMEKDSSSSVKLSQFVCHMMRGPAPYFSVFSCAQLCLLVYVNTVIELSGISLSVQLLAFSLLVGIWFLTVGLRVSSGLFAAFALQPANLLEGQGYFMFPGMSLSLSDLFSIIAILLFLANPTKMKNDFFSYSLFALLVVCLLSVLFSHDPIVHLGSLSRLFLLVGLVVIVLVSYGDDLKVSLFYSFLFWPFVMLAQLMAQDYLWRFLSFADGRSFFPYETGYMLLGGNLVVYHLFFLLPLLLFHRVSMRVWGLLIFYFIILSVYSHSRALVIAVGVSLMLYVMYYRDDNNGGSGWIGKIFIFGVTLGGVVYLTSFLGFFNFGIEDDLKSRSSYIRISKIKAAFDVYRDNPVIGIGYGAAGAIDSKRIVTAMSATDHDYLEQAINVQASAESTLPQIAAETGTVGLVVSLWLLALGFYGFRRSMRSSTMPTYAKITLLVLVVVFVVRFVSGNSYSEIPFFTAIPFVFRRIRWFSQNSRVRCM